MFVLRRGNLRHGVVNHFQLASVNVSSRILVSILPEVIAGQRLFCVVMNVTSCTLNRHTINTCQVIQKGNMRRSARVRALYHDVRRACTLFDNMHRRETAPRPGEL